MSAPPPALARHDCERLPDRAWLARLIADIQARDAREGLLTPPTDNEPAQTDIDAPMIPAAGEDAGIAWLRDLARRALPVCD